MVIGPTGSVVAPAGRPERVNDTEPVNPFSPETEMETFGVEFPEVTLRCPGDTERVKSATGGGGGGAVPLPLPQLQHTRRSIRTHAKTIFAVRPPE